jgi:cellulose synthase operon protein C
MPARINFSLRLFFVATLTLANAARAEEPTPQSSGATEPSPESPIPAITLKQLTDPLPRKAPSRSNVDDSAVRYYATHNEPKRMNAEIARLKKLYPGWEPSKEPYDASPSDTEDETDLWNLYTADRMDELETAINARKAAEGGWQPSQDLALKIRRKSARLKVAEYVKQGRWLDIVDYVHGAEDAASADADVDVLWAVAEAFARTKQIAEAKRIYKLTLTRNKNSDERLATIQKAMANMRMSDVEPLIAMGVPHADGTSEFAPIMIDITRARISAYLRHDREQDVPDVDLRSFEAFARVATNPNEAGLIGWYDYNHADYSNALEWFKLSIGHGGDAMVAHGLAHTLRALGYSREVEEVAYAWRLPLINNAVLFIDTLQADLTRETPPYIEQERLSRYAQETLRLASGEGAQGLAWYAYNSCQFDTALAWFERANAWAPKEATAYGYALTLRRLNRRREFFDVLNRYDGLFPKVIELIFPDNLYHAPTPCGRGTQTGIGSNTQSIAGVPVPQPARLQASDQIAISEMELKRRASVSMKSRQSRMPKIARSDFPIAVDSENELRFSALGEQSPPIFRAGEGVTSTTPLVARRVPGVGPMPYENYGFALLPAYNGTTSASAPHSALYAPAGTPWAEQMGQPGSSPSIPQFAPDDRNALLSQQPTASGPQRDPRQSASELSTVSGPALRSSLSDNRMGTE